MERNGVGNIPGVDDDLDEIGGSEEVDTHGLISDTPLPPPTTPSYFKRLRRIRTKPVLLLLVLNTLVDVTHFGAVGSAFDVLFVDSPELRDGLVHTLISLFTISLPFLVFPVAGWLADAHFGRFKTIVGSLWLLLIGYLLLFASVSLSAATLGSWQKLSSVVFYIIFPFAYLCVSGGIAGFHTNLIPFALNQMPSASTGEVTALLVWYYFTKVIGTAPIASIASCSSHYDISNQIPLAQSFIEIGCILIALLALYCLRDWLIEERQSENPFKTVYGTLKFAMQHKNPVNRSALTYWEESLPSRIDLAKDKYGGPYYPETVENVKTFLRITMVLLSLGWFAQTQNEGHIFFSRYLKADTFLDGQCSSTDILKGSLTPVVVLVTIPFYELLQPVISRWWTPNSLKKIGIGIIIRLVSILSLFLILLIGHEKDGGDKSQCYFSANSSLTQLDVPVYSIIAPGIIGTISHMVLFISG